MSTKSDGKEVVDGVTKVVLVGKTVHPKTQVSEQSNITRYGEYA